MKKKDITVEGLKELLLAKFKVGQIRHKRLEERLQQEFGSEIQKKDKPEELIAIENMIVEQISDVMARRLKAGRRATPLLSARDIMPFISQMIDAIEEKEDSKLEVKERKEFEGIVKKILEDIIGMMIMSEEDLYDERWRWVKMVYDVSTERGVLPTELFTLEGAADEVTRRMYTKERFIALSDGESEKFLNIDTLKKLVIEPMLDAIIGDNEERWEVEQEIEKELMPQLREVIDKCKIVANAIIKEEAARIYGADTT